MRPNPSIDLVAFRIDDVEHAGAQFDAVAALVTCAPTRAWLSAINGKTVVEGGVLVSVDVNAIISHHDRIAKTMLERVGLL